MKIDSSFTQNGYLSLLLSKPCYVLFWCCCLLQYSVVTGEVSAAQKIEEVDKDQIAYECIERAYQTYFLACRTPTTHTAERQQLLNEALALYLHASIEYPFCAEVYANIGMIYYYLNDPGLCVFYLLRAHSIDSNNEAIQSAFSSMQQALHLEGKLLPLSWYMISLHNTIGSISNGNAISIGLFTLSFILFSLFVWCRMQALKIPLYIFTLLFVCMVVITHVMPVILLEKTAVVTERLFLRASQSASAATSQDIEQQTLLSAGEQVYVLSQDPNGEWLRVKTGQGTKGYIPGRAVRIIYS